MSKTVVYQSPYGSISITWTDEEMKRLSEVLPDRDARRAEGGADNRTSWAEHRGEPVPLPQANTYHHKIEWRSMLRGLKPLNFEEQGKLPAIQKKMNKNRYWREM